MDFGLTVLRARHVEALLRGERLPTTAHDKLVLDTVAALHAWPPPTMRPEFRTALRARLLAEPIGAATADEAAATPIAPRRAGRAGRGGRHAAGRVAAKPAGAVGAAARSEPSRHWVGRLARPALVGALAASVAAVGLGTRTAMPGDPLYGVKRQVEQLQVTLAGSEVDQAEVRLDLARVRMDELLALVERSGPGDDEVLGLLESWKEEVGRGSDVLVDVANKGDTGARAMLESFAADQSDKLAGVIDAVSGDTATTHVAQSCLTVIEEMEAQLGSSAVWSSASAGSPDGDRMQRSDDSVLSPSPTTEPADAPTAPLSAPPDYTATPSSPASQPDTSSPRDEPAPTSTTSPTPTPTTTPLADSPQLGTTTDGRSPGDGNGLSHGIGKGNGKGNGNIKSSAIDGTGTP